MSEEQMKAVEGVMAGERDAARGSLRAYRTGGEKRTLTQEIVEFDALLTRLGALRDRVQATGERIAGTKPRPAAKLDQGGALTPASPLLAQLRSKREEAVRLLDESEAALKEIEEAL